jgi:DNA-binding SARP family transcriptional activator
MALEYPHIPLLPSPLVAREAELQAVVQLWRTARLVTLYGQSGVGKSALARAAAIQLAGVEPERVSYVDARGAQSGAAVLRLLAHVGRRLATGRGGDGNRPQTPTAVSPFYLLLDDLPATAQGAARGMVQWLVSHAHAHLLVVSRRPLEVLGEQARPLPPLEVAPPGETSAPAIDLFVEYAGRAESELSTVDRGTAAAICEALDGLPAALEAAASLVGILPVHEIVRIAQEAPLSLALRGEPLRAILTATWDVLPGEAREYLAANAGWPAGFAAEAGAALCAEEAAPVAAARLLTLGLLRIEPAAHLRYRMSPLIRALVNQAEDQSAPERQQRMARYLLGVAEREAMVQGIEDCGTQRVPGIAEFPDNPQSAIRNPQPLPEELPAIRWAWRWLAGRRDGDAVLRFARALAGPLTGSLGEPAEARELLHSALAYARAAQREEIPALEELLAAAEGQLWGPEFRRDGYTRTPALPHPPLMIRLLGPLTVEGPGGVLTAACFRPREQRVLGRLAMEPGRPVTRDELLDLFWPTAPFAAAERSLRTVVSALRRRLRTLIDGEAPRLISARLDSYCLEPTACTVDASLFVQAVQAARSARAGSDLLPAALVAWRNAIELYHGDLLGGFPYEDWCLTARERLRDDFLDALFQLARHALITGSTEEARGLAARMVEIDPAEERAHRLLMRCYAVLDRPAEALRQFERCRAALQEELAARPASATVALLEAIRDGATFAEEDETEKGAKGTWR